MFALTDTIVVTSDIALQTEELYKRSLILDQFERTEEQDVEITGIIREQIAPTVVSNESILDFITGKLAGLFGTYSDSTPPDPKLLAEKTKQFIADVQKTYANDKWVQLRTMLTEPITIGILAREWMLGANVLNDVSGPSVAIMKAIIYDIDKHGRDIEAYLNTVRDLGEAFYLVDPLTAVEMAKIHHSKYPMPKTPDPISVPLLGNYKISKNAGWWTLDVHPKTPPVPSLVAPLTSLQLFDNANALIELMQLLLVYENKMRDYNFTLPDKATIYADEEKRAWWTKAATDLGNKGVSALYSKIDPHSVIPQVAGLIPHYRSIGYRYAKAFYARMQASHK